MADRRKNRRDQDLRDAVAFMKSARKILPGSRFMPADKENQKRLADLLLSWSNNEESDDIDDFFNEREVGAMNFYRACENNPYLAEALEIALTRIGKRIRDRIKNSHDYNMKMLQLYQSLHRKEKKDKIEADRNHTVTTIYQEEKIQMPVFTNKKDK